MIILAKFGENSFVIMMIASIKHKDGDADHRRRVQGGVRDLRPHRRGLHHALLGQHLSPGDFLQCCAIKQMKAFGDDNNNPNNRNNSNDKLSVRSRHNSAD